uniref:Uncharacterized protein n=1 Tax=Bactrocera dorsalis TaxID=27457 RepID=A0A034V0G3_BACDO
MSKNKVHEEFTYNTKENKSVCVELLPKKKKSEHVNNDNSILKYVVAKTPKAQFSLTKEQLLEACLELDTKNGRPLKIFEDSGFRKIIDPICKTVGITINRQNIKEEIIQRAFALRSQITNRLTNR